MDAAMELQDQGADLGQLELSQQAAPIAAEHTQQQQQQQQPAPQAHDTTPIEPAAATAGTFALMQADVQPCTQPLICLTIQGKQGKAALHGIQVQGTPSVLAAARSGQPAGPGRQLAAAAQVDRASLPPPLPAASQTRHLASGAGSGATENLGVGQLPWLAQEVLRWSQDAGVVCASHVIFPWRVP
jgi:hypothetical protein